MKNVLMVATQFPPVGGGGVIRTSKFAKYLRDYGWNPIILTPKDPYLNSNIDSELLQDLPADLEIYRSACVNFYNLYYSTFKSKNGATKQDFYADQYAKNSIPKNMRQFLRSVIVPDLQIGWYPFAISLAKKLSRRTKIDLIYSSSPNPTAHIISRTLKQKMGKPWVADFRDPWIRFFLRPQRPLFLESLERRLEYLTIRDADAIVSVRKEYNEQFLELYPFLDKRKLFVIPNGFDGADFDGIGGKNFDKFTIVYIGRFFKGRTPDSFLEGFESLLAEKPNLRSRMQIVFVGREDSYTTALIDKLKLTDVVKLVSHVSHRESLSYLIGAHVCYLNTIEDYIPGKVYEYLASKKPILAILPPSSFLADVLIRAQAGNVIDPVDLQGIKQAISQYYCEYEKHGQVPLSPNYNVINQFDRKTLSGRLAQIFDKLVDTR